MEFSDKNQTLPYMALTKKDTLPLLIQRWGGDITRNSGAPTNALATTALGHIFSKMEGIRVGVAKNFRIDVGVGKGKVKGCCLDLVSFEYWLQSCCRRSICLTTKMLLFMINNYMYVSHFSRLCTVRRKIGTSILTKRFDIGSF